MSKAARLLKQQNFKVEKLLLLGQEKIPDDCDVLSIIGPTKPFSAYEIDLLRQYMSSGGKSLLMIDPLVNCGLEGLLEEWGVGIEKDIVLDPVRRVLFAGPATIFTDDFGYHEITEKMKGVAVIFSLARSVQFSPGGLFEGAELVKTSDKAWSETNLREKEAQFDEDEDKKGPICIAVAVSERESPYPSGAYEGHDEEKDHPMRLVVFGDSDFISDTRIGNVGNSDLFLNSINWLAEKEKLISIGPKSPDIRKISISANEMRAVFWGTIAGLPLLALCLCVIVWFRRRR